MSADRTITIELRTELEGGGIGEATFVYKPDDPMYDKTIRHVGGLKPGETKSVPPWK